MAIKGPSAETHLLRIPRQSVDIDFLVDPARFSEFVTLMESAGWSWQVNSSADVLPHHSVPMRHPLWPCELDLHHEFPGFLSGPEVTFEALWRHRETLDLGLGPVTCLDRVGTAAVIGLHLLRDQTKRAAELEEFVGLAKAQLLKPDRLALAELAQVAGAEQTLAPVLSALGIEGAQPTGPPTKDLQAWLFRTQTPHAPAVGWVYQFAAMPPSAWPRLIRKALLLTDEEIYLSYPDLPHTPGGLWRGRLRRWWRGLRHLPAAVRHVGSAYSRVRASARRTR